MMVRDRYLPACKPPRVRQTVWESKGEKTASRGEHGSTITKIPRAGFLQKETGMDQQHHPQQDFRAWARARIKTLKAELKDSNPLDQWAIEGQIDQIKTALKWHSLYAAEQQRTDPHNAEIG